MRDSTQVSQGDRLAWSIARWASMQPRLTTFIASPAAIAGFRLAQERLGAQSALWGHGGAYDPRGEVALYERARLFNRRPRAQLSLPQALETMSRGTRLLATPAQVDGAANANLSVIGSWMTPKVALGGTRGLPDATEIHFVIPLHTSRQLVERVDFVSTCAANRRVLPCLFTELGVLQWSPHEASWRLLERQIGVSVQDLHDRTGFHFLADDVVPEIPAPPAEMLEELSRVDPRRVRDLDFASTAIARQQKLVEIEAAERAACATHESS
jgi:hypothetical protein